MIHNIFLQLYTQLKQLKKFRPVWDSNSWPLQYWCSALPAELDYVVVAIFHYVK